MPFGKENSILFSIFSPTLTLTFYFDLDSGFDFDFPSDFVFPRYSILLPFGHFYFFANSSSSSLYNYVNSCKYAPTAATAKRG